MLEVRLDRVVGQLRDEVRLPVMLEPGRYERVEGAVERRVRHRADVLGDDRRDVTQRLEHLLALFDRARPARNECYERLPVAVFGNERQRRRDLPGREAAELLRGVFDELAVEAQHAGGVLDLEEHRAAVDVLDLL